MTIRGLEEHLKDRSHLVHELPLAALRDSRLGIDASSYVEGLLKENSTREPFVSGIGGAPLTLADTLHFHLKVLESYSIKPVFVFNGLQPRGTSGQQRERRSAALASKLTIRAAAWEHFENGDEAEAAEAFAKSNSLDAGDAWRTVQRVYKQRNVEHMAAPYLAAAQLIYLEKHDKSYIHAVFGPTELLLYDHIDRLIIGVNWSAQAFSFVSKREILHDLGLSHDQFLGLGLLAGCDYAPTFPAFSQPHAPDYNFRNVVQVLQNFKSAPAAIHYYLESMTHLKSTNVQDQFAQARALVKYPLVLTANQGRVLPLPLALSYTSAGEIPHDLHDVFSHRLPDELYFQFWRGLFSATVLDALVNEVWVDELPLDGGESDDYKRFLREVLSEHPQGPKAVALGLLSSVLNPQYWNKRTVSTAYFFDVPPEEGQPVIPYTSPLTRGVVERVNLWNVPLSMIQDELRRQNSNTLDFTLCLKATSHPKLAAATKTPRKNREAMEKKDEIATNVLWRFLEIRGFLNNEHSHTAYAKALLRALNMTRINDKFQEPLLLALELVRGGVLHSGKYGGQVLSGGPSVEDETDQANMLLIIRTVSIVPVAFLGSQAPPWEGPLSRELLVFNSFLKTLTRHMRALIESVLTHLLLRGDAVRKREDFIELSASLPFYTDPSTVMGIVVKGYCDAVHYMGSEGNSGEQMKQDVIDAMQQAFGSGIRDVKAEVVRSFRFWDCVCAAVKVLRDEKAIDAEVARQFEAADAWLKPYSPPGGTS